MNLPIIPMNCPEWEYTIHPTHSSIISINVNDIYNDLKNKVLCTKECSIDTRGVHGRMFYELAPTKFKYYAGHYRGEYFPCLINYNVYIPDDSNVGYSSFKVLEAMNIWTNKVDNLINTGDRLYLKKTKFDRDSFIFLLELIAEAYVKLLTIHPYVNGNGHIARFLLWCILLRYNYYPSNYPIEPSPKFKDKRYLETIVNYRKGEKKLIISYFIDIIREII